MLKRGSSGGIYIHPWDITDEGIDDCYDFLDQFNSSLVVSPLMGNHTKKMKSLGLVGNSL